MRPEGSLGTLGTLCVLRYHAVMSQEEHRANQRELADLQQDFPGYRIWQEPTGDRLRLVAVSRRPGVSPHTLVTSDPSELRSALANSTLNSDRSCPAATTKRAPDRP
jgi:hypothetical protein